MNIAARVFHLGGGRPMPIVIYSFQQTEPGFFTVFYSHDLTGQLSVSRIDESGHIMDDELSYPGGKYIIRIGEGSVRREAVKEGRRLGRIRTKTGLLRGE